MTIPTVITHANQQMYVFETFIEHEDKLLAKYRCLYCGSGDYVVSGVGKLVDDLELEGDVIRFDELEPTPVIFGPGQLVTQCCGPLQPQAVPEPGTGLLLFASLALGALLMRFRGFCRS